MIYTGIHIAKMDTKGRISIPSNFRGKEEVDFRFLKHPDSPVLIGHVASDLGEQEQVRALSVIFSQTVNCKKDGRACIPKPLRDSIGMDSEGGEVAIIGMGNHFQIWSLENWHKVEPDYQRLLTRSLIAASVWVPPSRN